jgi:hypothetical protein
VRLLLVVEAAGFRRRDPEAATIAARFRMNTPIPAELLAGKVRL